MRPLPRVFVVSVLISALTLPAEAAKPKKSAPAAPAGSAPTVPPVPAGPKPLSESLTGGAKADYDSAKLLYGDGDFAGARIKFQSAYDQAHDARLLWNIAACEKGMRHYAKVIFTLRMYLDTGGDLLTAQDRADAKDLLAAIESFTVALKIVVNEDGADVSIDDEPAGTSPLKDPIVVDIGSRKIHVAKPGFKPFEANVPVGGTKEATQEIKLEREVHEGKVTVRSTGGATISIDGKDVGIDNFAGTLPSGGHTLRVTAPGMRPVQNEIVISDNESRSIDVALEPLTVEVVPEKHGALYGMELGVRTGFGRQYNHSDEHPGMIPIWLDIGYRLGTPTLLGIYGQLGWVDRSGSCGVQNRHGPVPATPLDDAVRYSYDTCMFVKAGVQLIFHTLPRTIVDPWFGFDVGVHASFNKYRSYDPANNTYGDGNDNNASFQPGFQLGIDTHPWRDAGFGVFFQGGPEFGSEGQANNNNNGNNGSNGNNPSNVPCGMPGQPTCGNNNGCSGNSCNNGCGSGGSCNNDNGPTGHWVVGVRAAYTFP
jgi:hypothetical protein